jgi:hypothetical protein
MENQAVALAEAIGLPFVTKRVHPRQPWTWLPPGLWPAPLAALDSDSDTIAPPWPKLVITCGRRAVPYSLYIHRHSGGATRTVHIQNPQTRIDQFDMVIPPRHDHLHGPNVFETIGSLHRLTPARLQAAAADFAPRLAHLPRPLVAVLIGGSNDCYRLTPALVERLADQLVQVCDTAGVGMVVTPSRRTGEENIAVLRRALDRPGVEVWDFTGTNPYFGYVALADAIIVTSDSVNMVSEACSTGKPVHVVELEGGNRKFDEFHQTMRDLGLTRRFEGRIESWSYDPPDDTRRAADRVRELLGLQNLPDV